MVDENSLEIDMVFVQGNKIVEDGKTIIKEIY